VDNEEALALMHDIVIGHRWRWREQIDCLARDLYRAEFVAEAVDEDLVAVFDNAEDDASAVGIRERADQLCDGRGGRQHRFVFQLFGFGLTDSIQDVLCDPHSALYREPSNID